MIRQYAEIGSLIASLRLEMCPKARSAATNARLAAALRDMPSPATASTTRLRRSSESATPRLPLAASIMNQKKTDSGIPPDSTDSIRWETALNVRGAAVAKVRGTW